MTISDWNPSEKTPTRVYVNGTQIPASTLDLHVRKNGPLDISRYAEVEFCSPYNNKDFLSLFRSFEEITPDDFNSSVPNLDRLLDQQRDQDILHIETYSGDTDGYESVFRGIVTGVGPSDSQNRKIHQCRAQGPTQYLSNIPVSKVFGDGVNNELYIEDILDFVIETINENLSFDVTLSENNLSFSSGSRPVPDSTGDTQRTILFTNKTFQQNKHTLIDVINWARDKVSGRIWLEPTNDGMELIGTDSPTQELSTHSAHYLDGGLQIINNNALNEISPTNTIIVNGEAQRSVPGLDILDEFGITEPTESEYIQVKARHEELYQSNSEREIKTKVRKSDASSEQGVRNEARSMLKDEVDQATSGSMQVTMNTPVQPFETIEAKPTVNSLPDGTVPTTTYEVTRCHYKVRPSSNLIPHIDLTVGLHTDMQEDIVIRDSWVDERDVVTDSDDSNGDTT